MLAGSHVASGIHAGVYLTPSDIGCQYSRSTYTARFVWQPRSAADTSNWRQSLFCCCTASMEQAANGAETAAINRLVSSWSENISVSFCLRAPGYGLTLWCTIGLLVGGATQVPQLQLTECTIYLPFPFHPKLVLIYRPRRDGRLSWPGWLATYQNKCSGQGTEPGHGHPSQY